MIILIILCSNNINTAFSLNNSVDHYLHLIIHENRHHEAVVVGTMILNEVINKFSSIWLLGHQR